MTEVLAGRLQGFQLDYPCHSPTAQRWFVVRVARMAGDGEPRIVVAHDDVTALKARYDALEASLKPLVKRDLDRRFGRWIAHRVGSYSRVGDEVARRRALRSLRGITVVAMALLAHRASLLAMDCAWADSGNSFSRRTR